MADPKTPLTPFDHGLQRRDAATDLFDPHGHPVQGRSQGIDLFEPEPAHAPRPTNAMELFEAATATAPMPVKARQEPSPFKETTRGLSCTDLDANAYTEGFSGVTVCLRCNDVVDMKQTDGDVITPPSEQDASMLELIFEGKCSCERVLTLVFTKKVPRDLSIV